MEIYTFAASAPGWKFIPLRTLEVFSHRDPASAGPDPHAFHNVSTALTGPSRQQRQIQQRPTTNAQDVGRQGRPFWEARHFGIAHLLADSLPTSSSRMRWSRSLSRICRSSRNFLDTSHLLVFDSARRRSLSSPLRKTSDADYSPLPHRRTVKEVSHVARLLTENRLQGFLRTKLGLSLGRNLSTKWSPGLTLPQCG
jgi:hypothetical protein